MSQSRSFQLPEKVDAYLAALSRLYESKKEAILQDVVVNGDVSIHEEWTSDNWNGGTYGHAITLTVPEELFFQIVDQKEELQDRICRDINHLDNTDREHISVVFIELDLKNVDQWRQNSGIARKKNTLSPTPITAVHRIWGEHHVRLFLSHRSTVKVETSRLKVSLGRCGIAAFVAHEDIEPTQEWQKEIEYALFSMDALVALLTHDYHISNWTDQEVGVAIGRGVPHFTIRLGCDPYGLMGKGQAIGSCSWNDTDEMAVRLFRLLYKHLPDKSRLFECALTSYSQSQNSSDSAWRVTNLLSIFDTLTPSQSERVFGVYNGNRENTYSFDGMKALAPLLEKWTGREWNIVDNRIVDRWAASADDVPF